MCGLVLDVYVSKHQVVLEPGSKKLVMVSSDVDDLCASLSFGEYSSQHITVTLGPIPVSGKPPTIHNITHQVKSFAVVFLEELTKLVSFAALAS
jgi:hypothetical protein